MKFPDPEAAMLACGRKLAAHQRVMVERLRANATHLNLDDMGLGKTAECLLTPPYGAAVLAIVPASVRGLEREGRDPVGGWLAECARVRPDLKRFRLEGDARSILKPEDRGELVSAAAAGDKKAAAKVRLDDYRREVAFRWPKPGEFCVASYETMRSAPILETHTYKVDWPVWVFFDECHALKNGKALQTRAAERLINVALSMGGRAYGCTGTPLVKDPVDLQTLLRLFKLYRTAFPGDESDFGRVFNRRLETQTFGRHSCSKCGAPAEEGTESTMCCQAGVKKPKTVRSWVYPELTPAQTKVAAERLARVSLGRMLDDVMDLPPVLEVEHVAELNVGQLKALAALGKLSDEELAQAIERESVASDPDSHVARARAALASAKRAIVGDVLDEVQASEKVVFFADHVEPIVEAVDSRKRWGGLVGGRAWIHGEGDLPREEVVKRFAEGTLDGFAATLGAGGTGVDGLQRAARHVVLLEESWSPHVIRQAIARLRRMGQKGGAVVVHKFVTGHEVEDRVRACAARKESYLDMVDASRAPRQGELAFGAWDVPDSDEQNSVLGTW